jgi:hypothetical protein
MPPFCCQLYAFVLIKKDGSLPVAIQIVPFHATSPPFPPKYVPVEPLFALTQSEPLAEYLILLSSDKPTATTTFS